METIRLIQMVYNHDELVLTGIYETDDIVVKQLSNHKELTQSEVIDDATEYARMNAENECEDRSIQFTRIDIIVPTIECCLG